MSTFLDAVCDSCEPADDGGWWCNPNLDECPYKGVDMSAMRMRAEREWTSLHWRPIENLPPL